MNWNTRTITTTVSTIWLVLRNFLFPYCSQSQRTKTHTAQAIFYPLKQRGGVLSPWDGKVTSSHDLLLIWKKSAQWSFSLCFAFIQLCKFIYIKEISAAKLFIHKRKLICSSLHNKHNWAVTTHVAARWVMLCTSKGKICLDVIFFLLNVYATGLCVYHLILCGFRGKKSVITKFFVVVSKSQFR